MLFNSVQYLTFFVAVLGVSWLVAGLPGFRMLFVLASSYYFYESNNGLLVLLVVCSPAVDYFAGLMIERSQRLFQKRLFLTLSLVTNIGILAYFKYADFFASSISVLATRIGLHLGWAGLHIALPAGISFYTFQSMSYAIDVYRGTIPAERSFLRFNFYVTFFPHLIAGPIVRASTFLPQVGKRPRLTAADLDDALFSIVTGVFKKIVVADSLAILVARGFDHTAQADLVAVWLSVYAFAFQIYYDFSGYTDIAIGCSRLMGYRLPPNFARPYMAYSASDFWRRWHISLSTWLRDYLYIPLGGNRSGSTFRNYWNLMVTMLLGGLWHGAAWHFVLWGFLHGCVLMAERAVGLVRHVEVGRVFSADLVRRFAYFNFIVLTWLVFRCTSLDNLAAMVRKMFSFSQPVVITEGTLIVGLVLALGYVSQIVGEHLDVKAWFLTLPIPVKTFFYTLIVMAVVAASGGAPQPFIYFRF